MGAATLAIVLATYVKSDWFGKVTTGAENCILAGTITGSASYATGGDTVDLSSFYTQAPTVVFVHPANGYFPSWTNGAALTNNKVQLFAGGASAVEVTNATNVSAVVIPFMAVGGVLKLA